MQTFSEKQVHILETAEKLFAEKGYAATSVREIADMAGINLAMVSYYFGSKEGLLEELFAYRGCYLAVQLGETLYNESLSPLEKVHYMIDQYIDRVMEKPDFHKIMVREQMVNRGGKITELILDLKRRNGELLKKLIKEGQDKKVFRKHVDISLMVSTMIGTVYHLLSTQYYYRQLNDLTEMPEEEYRKYLRKKLSLHMKSLFKQALSVR